jgi:rod shape-determining protein MreB
VGWSAAQWGLDVGSGSTVVCDTGSGLLLDEPSVMLEMPHGGGTGIGRDAADLMERLPSAAGAVRPVRAGVVTDLDTARRYIRAVVRRVLPRPWQRTRLSVAVVVPGAASALERRALVEAAEEAGITRVVALAAPVAAAVGCGLDPLDRRAHIVADVGAGTAEIMAVCCGEVLAVRSTHQAGDALSAVVRRHLRVEHRLLTSPAMAEALTRRVSLAQADAQLAVTGRDIEHARPRSVQIAAAELQDLIAPHVAAIAGVLSGCLDDLPAQAVDDIAADGVLLVGGASPARGLKAALESGLGLPVKQAENPVTCIAEGAARSLLLPDVRSVFGRR